MILSIILFTLAVVFYSLSQIRVFAESDDWQNKYRKPIEAAPKTWYYKLTGVKFKEKFPLSATLLASLTDRYHAYQFFFKAFLCVSISPNWWAAAYFVGFGIIFTIVQRVK